MACDPAVNKCYDSADITNRYINLLSLDTQVDLNEPDKDKVVKYFINNSNFAVLDAEKDKKANLYFQQGEVNIDDSPFKILGIEHKIQYFKQNKRFDFETRKKNQDDSHMTIYLRSESFRTIYNRSMGSILDYLGDIGGMFELGLLFFTGIIGSIIDRSFKAAIIKDNFQV